MIGASILAAFVASFITSAVPDVSGHWRVSMAGEKQKPIEGALAVTQKGSELTATWQSIDEWTLTGKIEDNGRFVLESEARPIPATQDGKQSRVQARWVFRGALASGRLIGTAALEIAGRAPIPRQWSATKKSSIRLAPHRITSKP